MNKKNTKIFKNKLENNYNPGKFMKHKQSDRCLELKRFLSYTLHAVLPQTGKQTIESDTEFNQVIMVLDLVIFYCYLPCYLFLQL